MTRLAFLATLVLSTPAAVGAQALGTSRVSAAAATIYARCDPSSPPRATLRKGDTVTIESVNEGWVSVRVDASGERGCLKRSEIEQTSAIERAADARRAREIDRARGGTGRGPAPPSPTGRPLRVAVFGTGGVFNATAKESVAAVLDTRSGTDVGFGAQVAWQSGRLRGLFVEVDVSRFEKTGERVFVHDREVFPLGIPLTIGLTPIEVSAGYRVNPTRRTRRGLVASPVAYFAGGGIGSVGYREADDAETISERFTAYHVMGGADVAVWRMVQVRAEVRHRWVPDGLGLGGVSEAFNETDLGGTTFRVRIGVGF
jgi:hypothetical protein